MKRAAPATSAPPATPPKRTGSSADRSLRHVVLEALVQEVGETCNFTTLDGACVLYMDRVEAPWRWRACRR